MTRPTPNRPESNRSDAASTNYGTARRRRDKDSGWGKTDGEDW